MRKVFVLIAMFLCVGCGTKTEITGEAINRYEVKQTFDEEKEADFTFRFVSEKEEYKEGEEVVLYGELIYTGEDNVTISHASSYILFSIEEKVRDYSISTVVREIGMEKELEPMDPYQQDFIKQDVFSLEAEEEAYQDFIEDLKEGDDFPPGYYVVHGVTSFFDGTEHWEMEAEVDFKVLPEER